MATNSVQAHQPDFDVRKLRPVTVVNVRDLSNTIKRLTLKGPDITLLPDFQPTAWAKIFVDEQPGKPSVGRAYTLRNHDRANGEIDIDVVLHDDGPLGAWAAGADVGSQAHFAGPRGGYACANSNNWLLLAGDASALPAIASVLETVADDVEVLVFASLHDASDLNLLPETYRQRCRWTDLGDDALLDQIRAAVLPDAPGEVWGAGEAQFVRGLRRHVLLDRGLDKRAVHCTGYWKQGAQDHRDSESAD